MSVYSGQTTNYFKGFSVTLGNIIMITKTFARSQVKNTTSGGNAEIKVFRCALKENITIIISSKMPN